MSVNMLKERVEDHEERIRVLEKEFPRLQTEMKNLVETMKSLISWVKALVVVFTGACVGFGFWVLKFIIQHIADGGVALLTNLAK